MSIKHQTKKQKKRTALTQKKKADKPKNRKGNSSSSLDSQTKSKNSISYILC